ncbi:hypothetical protein IPZ61_02735 [Streptomyces sioyaensis]|uniref:hypothetical protein n=1 Tax=Streptomyces sioyaensis TaxID=67364 RepID=UPI001F2E4504|nr:hypothetical protein [Streptomyces sioyaensis]MCF3172248.1 hypothetical protein [Streptomyces sioyaensis]
MTTTVPPALAELTEILAYADFATSASASVREALGLGSLHVCTTRALAIREESRALGKSLSEAAPRCYFRGGP